MHPDACARRDRGRLTESRAAGQQGQHSDDGGYSTDFHGNVLSLNRIRRPGRRMTEAGRQPVLETHVSGETGELRSEALSSFVLVLRNDDRSRRAEQIGEAGADGID